MNKEVVAIMISAARQTGRTDTAVLEMLTIAERKDVLDFFCKKEVPVASVSGIRRTYEVKLLSPMGQAHGSLYLWQENKIACIKATRAVGQMSNFDLKATKDFVEGNGTLNVTETEYHRLCGIFGLAALITI